MDSKLIWIIVVIAAAAAVYVFMREKINLRKAAGGEDKERLRKAVARLCRERQVSGGYGHFEKRCTMDAGPMSPTIPMPLPVTQAVSGSYPCPLIRSLSCRESQS